MLYMKHPPPSNVPCAHFHDSGFMVFIAKKEADSMKNLFTMIPAGMLVLLLAASPCQGLTADQVLKLKKAGVSDRTIQLMIEQEREAKESPYETMGVREVRDSSGNVVVVHSTGRSKTDPGEEERKRVEKAWEILRNIVVDDRRRQPAAPATTPSAGTAAP